MLLGTHQCGQMVFTQGDSPPGGHMVDRGWTKRVYLSWMQKLRLGQCQISGKGEGQQYGKGRSFKDLTVGKPKTSPTHHQTQPPFQPIKLTAQTSTQLSRFPDAILRDSCCSQPTLEAPSALFTKLRGPKISTCPHWNEALPPSLPPCSSKEPAIPLSW